MAQPQVIIDQSGPLPITKDVTLGSVGPATLVVAGSVWSKQPNTLIGVEVVLDGAVVGTAQIFSNGASTHRNVVPKHIPIELDKAWPSYDQPPTYTITLQAMNGSTVSDQNDYYQVVINA